MAEIITLPKVHRKFFANATVRAMISLGYTMEHACEVHESFEHQMNWTFAGPHTDRSVRALFDSILQHKHDALDAEERERIKKRAERFAALPREEWWHWSDAQWKRRGGDGSRKSVAAVSNRPRREAENLGDKRSRVGSRAFLADILWIFGTWQSTRLNRECHLLSIVDGRSIRVRHVNSC
jgi:hypothetical protein